jgi:hypothetical protein
VLAKRAKGDATGFLKGITYEDMMNAPISQTYLAHISVRSSTI